MRRCFRFLLSLFRLILRFCPFVPAFSLVHARLRVRANVTNVVDNRYTLSVYVHVHACSTRPTSCMSCCLHRELYEETVFLHLVLIAGPRRMSERDLPSRLGRDAAAPQQQMHTSKSVPALHSK